MHWLSEEVRGLISFFGQERLFQDRTLLSEREWRVVEGQILRWRLTKEAWSSPYLGAHQPFVACRVPKPVGPTSLQGVGCVILAGGQGSRLGITAPKGTFCLRGRSLFEHLLGSVIEKGRFVAVMTSLYNHEKTVSFFREHQFFGLTNLHFFSQGMLPLLGRQGHWCWDQRGHLAEGPDGNGSFFFHFVASGLAALAQAQGIEVLQLLAVDNVLGRPFDDQLIEGHREAGVDVTVSAVERRVQEAMGLLVEKGGRLCIAEYSEVDRSCLEKREKNGSLLYAYGNGGRWMMNRSFVEEMARRHMTVHWADKQGFWKGERFILDALHFGTSQALLFPRASSYAPLKKMEQVAEIEAIL